MESEDTQVTTDKQAPRRVITDTGDIVEEQLVFKAEDITQKDTIPLGKMLLFLFNFFLYVMSELSWPDGLVKET